MQLIKGQHDAFVGKTGFEELSRRLITHLGDRQKLSFVPDYIGRIWDKRVEIDVVAINKVSQNILLGECKWSHKKVNGTILDSLIQKSKSLTKIKPYKIHFALFSKNGFTADLVKRAQHDRVLLFQGAAFERIA